MKKYLSQVSVYNQIRGAVDGNIGASLLFDITYTTDNLKIIATRNGPAFTVTVESVEETICFCCRKAAEELFHCDFTFALYSPKFPLCAQGKLFISNQNFSFVRKSCSFYISSPFLKHSFWNTNENSRVSKTAISIYRSSRPKVFYKKEVLKVL